MAKVFVLWYGKVLEGETDGTVGMFGMLEVRIHVQGMKATALFAPEHVYESEELAAGNHTEISANSQKAEQKQREISISEDFDYYQERINEAIMNADPLDFVEMEARVSDLSVLRFKQANWDHQRNHLRIDALDQFYQLWRDNMAMRLGTDKPRPAMKTEAPLTPDEAASITQPYSPITVPYPEITKGYQKKGDVSVVQLSLFD